MHRRFSRILLPKLRTPQMQRLAGDACNDLPRKPQMSTWPDTRPGCIPLNRGISMTERCWDTDAFSPVPEASRCDLPARADSSRGISCTRFESCRFAAFAQILPRLLRPQQQTDFMSTRKSEVEGKDWNEGIWIRKTRAQRTELFSQHTRPSVKSVLCWCSSGTAGKINCPTFVPNTSLANKLEKDSRGTRYRTRRRWGRPSKAQKVFRGL